jgi:hypothetical protein
MLWENKLERLSFGRVFRLVYVLQLHLALQWGTIWYSTPLEPTLISNVRPAIKCLPWTNTLAYFATLFVSLPSIENIRLAYCAALATLNCKY